MYTTHGLMTPEDYADHRQLYDIGCEDDGRCPDCGGPLASDGVCADDTCGDDDAVEITKWPDACADMV